MNKKRLTLGIIFLILFSPFFLAGVVWYFVHSYLVAGYEIGDVLREWIDEKLGD